MELSCIMLFPAILSASVFSFPLTFLLRAGAIKYKYEFYFVGSDNVINGQCSTPFNLLSYIAAADCLLETEASSQDRSSPFKSSISCSFTCPMSSVLYSDTKFSPSESESRSWFQCIPNEKSSSKLESEQ